MAFQTIAINLGVAVSKWLWNRYVVGERKPDPPQPGNLEVTKTQEGQPIPLLYGTRRVPGNVVLVGRNEADPRYIDTPVGAQIIGYTYRVAFQLIFALSNRTPVYGSQASLKNLYAGDKRLILNFDPDPEISLILENDIYGGPSAGGGILGRVIFQGGTWEQTAPALWAACIAGPSAAINPTLLGGNRGQIVGSFLAYDTTRGMVIGESPNLEPISAEIYSPVSIRARTQGFAQIGTGDSNPASILYNLLVERGGIPEVQLDIDNFAAVAALLEQEEHGCSFEWRGGKVIDHVKEVEAQADVTVRRSRTSGLYEIKMIRQDYDPDDAAECPVFGPADLLEIPKFSTTTWAEVYNEVRVTYSNRELGYTQRAEVEQNGALIDAQLGRRRTKEIAFPGVCTAKLAAELAARELNSIGRPTVRVRAVFNRRAHRLRRGDVFRLLWPERDVNMVFRVVRAGGGSLERGTTTIDALQDRYDGTRPSYVPPDSVGPVTYLPRPVVDWIATETPRWVLAKAFDAGLIANVDASRGFYLAAPEGDSVLWRARDTIGAAAQAIDYGPRAFPGRFIVDADYARTVGPYDTSTGIQVRDVDGVALAMATGPQISVLGYNLIQIGQELLAFGSFADLGGGLYQLEDVWRGVLDTVPADHAEGDVGFFLPGPAGSSAIGSTVLPHAAAVESIAEAGTGSGWTPTDVCPVIDFTARSRTLLPYPPDALTVNGSQAPAAIGDDEGVVLDWRDRDRLADTITRPDAADEVPEAGTTYAAVAYKGDGPQDDGTQIVLADPHSSHTTKVALGAAGHGLLEVGVDARKAVSLPDSSTPILGAFQVPTLPITAHHYRNLLLNPRFAEAATIGWTWTVGTPATSTTNALGGAGSYVTTAVAVANLDGYQTRSIAGYDPAGLRATLYFAAVKDPAGGGGADAITVYLYSLDSVGNVLDTATYGPSSPAAWAWQVLDLATLNAATVSIKVRVVMAGGGARALCGFTESHLYVGQVSGQLLVNPSFEANPVAPVESWTETVGTWQGLTATKYGSPTYVRPNDAASAQLQQDITITTGYEGGVAVLRGGRMNDDASDTGKVTIAALGVADVVLASTSTAEEAITPTSTWARRLLALELPATTLKVRVRLDATRVSGTPLNACFDDFDLRLHKHLDPDQEITATFDTPMSQRLPSSRYQWLRDFPAVVAPNHAIYDGGLVGRLGPEPLLEAVGVALSGGTIVVDQALPSAVQTTTAYEMPNRTSGSAVQVAPVGTSFANFSSAQDWAALVFFRTREPGAWNGAADLCGRVVGAVGWYLWITLGGRPALTVIGTTGTVTLTGDEVVIHGDISAAGVTFDSIADTITLVDGLGSYTASTATIGQFRGDDVGRFAFWGSGSGLPPFAGQIARGYMWRGARPTAAELRSTLTYLAVPSALSLVASW